MTRDLRTDTNCGFSNFVSDSHFKCPSGVQLDTEVRFFEFGGPTTRAAVRAAAAAVTAGHGDPTPGSTVWVPVDDDITLQQELLATGYQRMNPGIGVDSPGGPTMEVIDPFSNTIRFC